MTSHAKHAPPTAGDIAYETFYSAALGGLVIALFFLAVDLFMGRPLYTPSLLGTVLFFGADPAQVEGINLTGMALFTVLHLGGFGILGFVSTYLVRFLEERTGGGFFVPAFVLFVLVEGGFLVLDLFIGVGSILGQGMVLAANALVAVTMTIFLRQAHDSSEGESQRRAEAAGAA